MKRLTIGLIGASRVATYAIIAPARRNEKVEVKAIAARDPGRAREYSAKHGIDRIHPTYAALIGDPEIDLIYLGTPPALHADQALAAIAGGKPVLVEKPFALSADQARRVRDASRKAGVPVFEAMHSPHHGLFSRILEIVRSGAIGTVRSVEASFEAPIPISDPIRWTSALGGGALMDLGVYPLAWLRRLAGEEFSVGRIDADFRDGVDASFTAELHFHGAVTGKLAASMASSRVAATLVVRGDEGVLDVRNPLAPQLGHLLTLTNGQGEQVETVEGPSSFEAQLEAIRATLAEGVPFPFPDDDYVRSMEAIERVRSAFPVEGSRS